MSESKLDPSTGLTCISCRLVFANSDVQRDHYRTEWHRYNVKRQVACLPPISQEDFATRVKIFNDEKTSTNLEEAKTYCEACKKPFQSEKAYDNHLNSNRHRERISMLSAGGVTEEPVKGEPPVPDAQPVQTPSKDDFPMEEDSGDEDGDSSGGWRTVNSDDDEDEYDETNAIPETSCLFCSVASSSISNNLKHMTMKHGFSVPDHQYCDDLEGLLKYLGMKIGCGNECIACSKNVHPFRDRDSCQKHMRDKNHCSLNVDGENIVEYMEFYDYSELMAEEGNDGDDNFIDDGSFLTLPSGAKIGHRSLARYFRQSLKGDSESGFWATQKKLKQKLISNGHIKALGWSGVPTSLAVKRARDMKCIKKVVDTYRLKQGLKSNKLFKTRGRKDQQ